MHGRMPEGFDLRCKEGLLLRTPLGTLNPKGYCKGYPVFGRFRLGCRVWSLGVDWSSGSTGVRSSGLRLGCSDRCIFLKAGAGRTCSSAPF